MTKSDLPDIQNDTDLRGKRIKKVGVRELIVPIKIIDSNNKIRNTVGNVSLYTSLEHDIKGSNMSRFVEVIHNVLEKDAVSLNIIKNILQELKKKLGAKDSYVKIGFTYFQKKQAPITKKVGYVNYDCSFEGRNIQGQDKIYLHVCVPYTSLCPCSKEISNNSAHNQKSTADVTIEIKKSIKIEDIINIVEHIASCELYSMLKREDEKYVTEKAYANPKFVEDMTRDISIELDKMLDKKINDYVIVINHYESIHNHIAVAIINAGRILK